MKRTIELTADEVKDFALMYGWTEKIVNDEEKEVDNPVSAEDVFDKQLEEFVNGTIQGGRIKKTAEANKVEIDALKPTIEVT